MNPSVQRWGAAPIVFNLPSPDKFILTKVQIRKLIFSQILPTYRWTKKVCQTYGLWGKNRPARRFIPARLIIFEEKKKKHKYFKFISLFTLLESLDQPGKVLEKAWKGLEKAWKVLEKSWKSPGAVKVQT